MKFRQKGLSTIELIAFMELDVQYDRIEDFFAIEEELLSHLYQLEKKEAQQKIRQLLKMLSEIIQTTHKPLYKYYLSTLFSIVTRKLSGNLLTVHQAFVFNITCQLLIDKKVDEHTYFDVADELIEFYMFVVSDKKQPKLMHSIVNSVICYIDEEVETLLTVEGIAKKFNISTSHLSRIFREHTGVTLVEYINIRKVEESQYYLRFSTNKISDISNQFHFCNQSYFTRVFKKYTGLTPSQFRSNFGKDYYRFLFPKEHSL